MTDSSAKGGRRDFLKRAAIVAAGTAWVAPTVQTLAAGSAAAGSAPPANQGCVSGLVTLPSGVAAVGVSVFVQTGPSSPDANGVCRVTGYLTTTGSDGRYTLCLPAGTWTMVAGSCPDGTYTQSSANVTVVAGVGQTKSFVLGPPCVEAAHSACGCRQEPGDVAQCLPGP